MNLYYDSSALAKQYLSEEGSDRIVELTATATTVTTSILTLAEMGAAISRAACTGRISNPLAAELRLRLSADWPSLLRLTVTESIVRRAAALTEAFPLRGFDAIHLASAVAWKEQLALPVTFATFDRDLWRAARGQGLAAWPEAFGD